MRSLLASPSLVFGLACCFANLATAAEVDGATALARAFKEHRYELQLDHGHLSGPGAERLLTQARAAQFVLVGEDHGFADVPEFAAAVYAAISPQGERALVVEAGPLSTGRIEAALRKDTDGLAALNRDYPFALPFFSWREEGALAAGVVRAHAAAPALWGIDQEFILSPRMHFQRLAELAPNAAARALALDYAKRDADAYEQIVAQHNPSLALLTKLGTEDFDRLSKAYAGAAPEAATILTELSESAAIYRDQETSGYASNSDRSAMMKRHFMAFYRAAAAKEPLPRAMFKLGAYHAGRGLSPTHLYDIGNLASELAASNGSRSYHVLIIAAGGHVNRWFPFVEDVAAKSAVYDAKEELASFGAEALLKAVDPNHWTLVDLAPLRTDRAAREAGGAAFANLVFAYDAVVVVPQARAAGNY